MSMPVGDWTPFYENVCPELNIEGWREDLYVPVNHVVQWSGGSGTTFYRMTQVKDPDYYTWFQRCIEPMLILEAHNPSLMERRPSTAMSAVSNQWFETLFFIQWSDWPAMRSVSEEIDRVLQKFPASPNGWYPDISGAQAMLMVLKNSYFFV